MTRVEDQPALVLHVRPYRETSAVVGLLTPEHGRVAAVARGVRGPRGTTLQPFNRLRVAWQGRGTLLTLTQTDLEKPVWLAGTALTAGLYLVELLDRLVTERERAPRLFAASCWALEGLMDPEVDIALTLRRFEQFLLAELGYSIEFGRTAGDGHPLDPETLYRFEPGTGFVRAGGAAPDAYLGQVLLAVAEGDYATPAARRAARQVAGRALAVLLGPRPLVSRGFLTGRSA
ncbi:MAG: DNA repair protein RecO [Pseudomonadales bacterium]